MDPEIQALKKEISELKALVVENTVLLTKINHRSRLSTIGSVVKWTFIIGASIGAFYFVQPFIDILSNVYSNVGGGSTSTIKDINQVLDQYMMK